ncbi:threonine--tRNA ligase [Candidatus Kaiserbacteria bacterium RIFCSPHIGHO2_01_FULL_54_36]|uniref:Threonine--tRNA ligase n=1 Tax=Candidatus Kaiserbacteria bacterium RIFCSPHIGHO2_01_FULL_54_36 TaxID=1798482 RepID=A0A1F6CPQ9_9BACT|nr:MAG: threonine--tRNA ligase [Candidatus Kaiserbacteria bacterium RIFCSPHIGHO2_01_FULL_54_36]OGG75558.1 MAG: threonine--tRNA ligase [Candidatus Kaiserbacteria bacterium RIFCSPLOWO2_01_FULL_54_22]
MAEIEQIGHTLAHLTVAAVRELWPGSQNAIGPSIDNGFYQDFEIAGTISDADLPKIEAKMRELLPKWTGFEKKEVSKEEALKEFAWNTYKSELIEEFAGQGKKITFHNAPGLVDLCRGGHVENPAKEIAPDSFKLDRIAGAYWRGDEKNKMLTRIYGLAFPSKQELDAYLKQREEAKKRDHRKIAREQGLLVFSDLVGSGMPLYTPKGNIVRNAIVNYSRELNDKLGFGEVHTPNINKAELFKISGHYDAFKDDMLKVSSQYVADEMYMKPMNCPQHTQIYASQMRSYRDLPIRYADFANLYRDERPGELSGLTRLRAFAQDDGHIFCREDQIESEVSAVLSAIQEALATYRIDYWMRFSLRDPENGEKYLGDPAVWEHAQTIMRELLQKKGVEFKEAVGEAAFYGPKIDIMAVDAIGRQWQISTIQLDFVQPSRFKLEYTGEDGRAKTPVMIHRALIGSPDRFLGILIEHYAGAFPLWMAPVQARVLPVSDKFSEYAKELQDQLLATGIRADLHDSDSLGKRIRSSKVEKIPYVLVVGDEEMRAKTATLEGRAGKIGAFPIAEIIARLKEEIQTRAA